MSNKSDVGQEIGWFVRVVFEVVILGMGVAPFLSAMGTSDANVLEPAFRDAVEGAGVQMLQMGDAVRTAQILGNGDLTGLLFEENGRLVLSMSKNDVWDARIDTSRDPELLTIDVQQNTIDGPFKGPASWHDPYPAPWICGRLLFGSQTDGSDTIGSWRCIRAQGTVNEWGQKGERSVMCIEGRAGASNGYALDLTEPAAHYNALAFTIRGSANARYYVDLVGENGQTVMASGWQESPEEDRDVLWSYATGKSVRQAVLYTWTEDGELAKNHFSNLRFMNTSEGGEPLVLPAVPQKQGAYSSALDLLHAKVDVEKRSADGGTLGSLSIRALANRNAFLIEGALQPRLLPNRVPHVPEAETGTLADGEWLVQSLPPDEDWVGMQYAIVLLHQDGRSVAAVVTSFESKNPKKAALALARSVLKDKTVDVIAGHEREWGRYWAQGGVLLEDRFLLNTWYRNLYFLRCVSRPGAKAVGLFAGSGKNEYMWHGSHTLNYNSEQTFWGGFNVNRVALSDPYTTMIRRYLPRATWFGRKVYGFDGALYPHNVFTHEPPDPEACVSRNHHMHAFPPYAYTIGLNGHILHNVWQRYLYEPNDKYLTEVAYPVIRASALFYVNFVERCTVEEDGKVRLGPSYSPEHWSMQDPNRNHNCTYDIALIQLTLKACMRSATALDCDEDLVARCKKVLALLPAYPTTAGENPVVVDVRGATPLTYNITVPTIPVFPGDQVTWFSPEPQKELFRRTIEGIRWNGNNAMIMLAVARARLSIPGSLDWFRRELEARSFPNGSLGLNRRGARFNGFGIYTEQFAASAAITEYLLQSVGGVIRFFPAWPENMNARFQSLRAEGGFLVSAEWKDGAFRQADVVSTLGGTLRVLNPQTGAIDSHETKSGERIVIQEHGTDKRPRHES